MPDPIDFQLARARNGNPPVPLHGGGGGGTFDLMEARVSRLEEDSKEMRADLKAIRVDLAEIKGMLKAMPSAASVGELKGRVDSLPTTAKVGTLLGIAVAIITIVTKWSEIVPAISKALQ